MILNAKNPMSIGIFSAENGKVLLVAVGTFKSAARLSSSGRNLINFDKKLEIWMFFGVYVDILFELWSNFDMVKNY